MKKIEIFKYKTGGFAYDTTEECGYKTGGFA